MQRTYQKIIAQILRSGRRLVKKAGKIRDIGVTKRHLTEEDIRIERELHAIITRCHPTHVFYAEEENDRFIEADDVWVADPISGTSTFIDGLPHYGIILAHLHRGRTQFAVAYDPSADEIFTAYRGKGAWRNGNRITMRERERVHENPRIIFNLSLSWKDDAIRRKMFAALCGFELYRLRGSHTINEEHITTGAYDGAVSLTKDSFPYFASSLIIQEAGGVFTNLKGESDIKPTDRVFISGNRSTYRILQKIVTRVSGRRIRR